MRSLTEKTGSVISTFVSVSIPFWMGIFIAVLSLISFITHHSDWDSSVSKALLGRVTALFFIDFIMEILAIRFSGRSTFFQRFDDILNGLRQRFYSRKGFANSAFYYFIIREFNVAVASRFDIITEFKRHIKQKYQTALFAISTTSSPSCT